MESVAGQAAVSVLGRVAVTDRVAVAIPAAAIAMKAVVVLAVVVAAPTTAESLAAKK